MRGGRGNGDRKCGVLLPWKKVTRSNEWLARVTSPTCRHLPPHSWIYCRLIITNYANRSLSWIYSLWPVDSQQVTKRWWLRKGWVRLIGRSAGHIDEWDASREMIAGDACNIFGYCLTSHHVRPSVIELWTVITINKCWPLADRAVAVSQVKSTGRRPGMEEGACFCRQTRRKTNYKSDICLQRVKDL